MLQYIDARLKLSREIIIRFRLQTELQELVFVKSVIGVLPKKSDKILAGYWIDDFKVLLSPDLGILFEDGWICLALVDTCQTIVKSPDIDYSAGKAKSAERITNCG